LPQTLAFNISSVAISDVPECGIPDRQTAAVSQGYQDGNKEYPSVSFFLIPSRPQYTLGDSPSETTVCVDNKAVGRLDYYVPPELLMETHPAFPLQVIEFRIFSNFGWNHKFPKIRCNACNPMYNTVSYKEKRSGVPSCSGRREQNNPFFNTLSDSDTPVTPFPFTLKVSPDSLEIWSFSSDRLTYSSDNSTGLKQPMQVCFYADRNAENGIYLGDAEFHLSENDTGALVVFLLYLGLAFPVICLATTLLQCFRLRRHRQWVRSVKHYIQRLQLEQEMLLPQFPLVESDIITVESSNSPS
jgi:hypothetical protein